MQDQKTEMNKGRRLWTLFISMLYISAFTFGGGFVIVNFMRRRFIDELHWIEEEEMLDMIAMAQSSPGAIAVNAANLVGWRVAGFPGMMVAILGTVIPPMLILTVISLFYEAFASNRYVALTLRGMQAGVAAVILDVALSLGEKVVKERSIFRLCLLAAAFAASFVFQVNAVVIVLSAALLGVGAALWNQKKKGAAK